MSTIQCSACGKFISYKEIDSGQTVWDFTPDTHFTSESCDYYHRKCVEPSTKEES